jgi:hypothetical protein
MLRKYTSRKALQKEICARLAEGETLRRICRDEGMPAPVTVYAWMEKDAAFAERIARARETGFDAIADDALEIADTQVEGETMTTEDGRVKVVRGDMLGHRKLQVWARLQLLSKWCPKKYGNKVGVEASGGVEVKIVSEFSDG